VYRERGPTVTACGNEVSDMRAEEVVQTQEEDIRSALSLSAVTVVDKVCYVCNIVLVTLVHVCTVASAFWQCVVWCSGVTL
jgi:predicted  nucleic acid-binding Zn-ribbon protein